MWELEVHKFKNWIIVLICVYSEIFLKHDGYFITDNGFTP